MKVINMYGGPGSGKSTTAAGLFYHMKLLHMNVELVTEYAKDLVYSNTLSILTKSHQEVIFAEQFRRQRILEDKVDWAITDSPLLFSLVYGTGSGRFNESAFTSYVVDTFDCFKNINYFLRRPNVFTEVGRDHNLQQSQEIDGKIKSVLKDSYAQYKEYDTNENVVALILEDILANHQ